MNPDFIPFPKYNLESKPEEFGFKPIPPPEQIAPSPLIPADKALADLAEAIRLGLDGDPLAQVLAAASRLPKSATQARPLTLRDLTMPPTSTTEPLDKKSPGIVVTRIGNIVQKVTVECPCGERISLDCVY